MKRVNVFLILCLLSASYFANAQTAWTAYQTGGSTNFQGVGSYSNSAWVGVGWSGEIYYSNNGGTSWTSQNSTTTVNLHDVTCLSSNVAYAVADSGIILKTGNAGNTWVRQTSGSVMPIQSIVFTTNQIGFACGWAGTIFSTFNGGVTWSINQQSLSANFMDLYFVSSLTGYAVGWTGVIYKTVNAGGTWTPQSSGTNEILNEVFFHDSLSGMCVGSNGTMLRTIDGGINWNPVASFTTDNIESLEFVNSSLGFCGTDQGQIFVTNDGGATWTLTPSNSYSVSEIEWVNNFTCIAASNLGYIQESTYLDWAGTVNTDYCEIVRFFNDSVGIASSGTHTTILRTTDAGSTWNVVYTGTPNSFSDLQILNDTTAFMAGGLYLYKTFDQGLTWTSYNQSYGVGSLSYLDPDTGYFDNSSPIKRTFDGGVTWSNIGDYYGRDAHFFDLDTGYAFQSTMIRFTDDGGNTWIDHLAPCDIDDRLVLHKNTIFIWDNGYMTCCTPEFYRTDDGGYSFTQIILPFQGDPDYYIKDIWFTDSLNGYLAYEHEPWYDLYIYKTTDGGVNWLLQGTEFDVGASTSFGFASHSRGVCTSAQGIMHSNNTDPVIGIQNPPFNNNVYVRQPAALYSWIMEPGDGAQLNMSDSRDAHFTGTETDYAGHLVFSGQFNDKCEVAGVVMDSPQNGQGIFVGRCREDKYVEWVVPFYVTVPGAEALRITSTSSDWFNEVLIAGVFSGTMVVGSYTLTCTTPGDFIIKLDSTGNVMWAKSFTVNATMTEHYFHAELDSIGHVFFTGNYVGTLFLLQSVTLSNLGHAFVGKISDVGVFQWCIQSYDNCDTRPISCSATPDGYVVVCGRFNGSCRFGTTTITSTDSNDIFIAKFYYSGFLQWIARANGPGNDLATDIDCDQAGNVYVVGTFENMCRFDSTYVVHTNPGVPAMFYAKYDVQGNFQWVYKIVGVEHPYLSVAHSGNCYITGCIGMPVRFADTTLVPTSAKEIVAFKTNPNGKILWVTRLGGAVALNSQENLPTGIIATLTDNCYITGKAWGYGYDSTGTYQVSTGTVSNAAYYGYFAKIGYGLVYNSIDDTQQAAAEISVFPVPADEEVSIDWMEKPTEPYSIQIIDALGRSVLYVNGNQTGNNVISISAMDSGFYTVIITSDVQTYSYPMIISH